MICEMLESHLHGWLQLKQNAFPHTKKVYLLHTFGGTLFTVLHGLALDISKAKTVFIKTSSILPAQGWQYIVHNLKLIEYYFKKLWIFILLS